METTSFDDIEKIGPGIWFKIHMDAIKAITLPLKESFVININALCNGFRCKRCQPHFRKFIDSNSLKKYFDVKDGIFKWTWELHNDVNSRLSKYQPTYEEAYNFYFNSHIGGCLTCGGKNRPEINLEPVKSLPQIQDLKREHPKTFLVKETSVNHFESDTKTKQRSSISETRTVKFITKK